MLPTSSSADLMPAIRLAAVSQGLSDQFWPLKAPVIPSNASFPMVRAPWPPFENRL